MTTIRAVVDNGLCTGCGGCVSALKNPDLTMRMAQDGYLRPTPITLTKPEEDVFDAVCAGKSLEHGQREEEYHPLWGPIRHIETAHAVDPEVRYAGSSGGVISALGIYLVETGAVEFILSTSASDSDPIANRTAPRAGREDVIAAAGSRYAPSSPLADIEDHLAAGRRFAFVGKPCDVAALRRMAKRDPRIDRQIPYMLSFFCAGIPSRKGTLDVLHRLGVAIEDVATFRYRGEGWPGLAKAQRHDGSQASMTYQQSWGEVLGKQLQFRCKICPDGTGEFADVACADAWYGEDGYPDFTESEGRSLMVSRTSAGERLVKLARDAGVIQSQPLPVEDIALMQPYQATRKPNVLARSAALFAAKGIAPRFYGFDLLKLALRGSYKAQLANLVGTLRRLRR